MNPEEPDWELAIRAERIGAERLELVMLADFGQSAVAMDRHARGRRLDERVDLSPMFGVIWPAARALAGRVAEDEGVPGASVLELACGLGLPSLVAARRGARVLATDQHPHTESFLVRNLARNHIEGVAYQHLDLRGGWNPHPGRFARVVASDVLYAIDLPGPVATAFADTLAPGGVGYLADPGRAWLPEFVEACEARGLTVRDEVVDAGPDEIWLFTLRP